MNIKDYEQRKLKKEIQESIEKRRSGLK